MKYSFKFNVEISYPYFRYRVCSYDQQKPYLRHLIYLCSEKYLASLKQTSTSICSFWKKKMMNKFCIKGFYEGIFINIYDLTQYSLYTYIRARSASRSTVVMTQWDYSFFGRRIISIFPSFYYVNSWIECTSNSYLLMSNESKRKK